MYKQVAEKIMFTKYFSGSTENLAEHGLQYRKNKTIDDLRNALSKARKNGMQKTEHELAMFEIYIKQVLKPLKVK